MNRVTRALTLLWVTCAFVLAVGASSAFAVTLTPTNAPLPGSNFQGGDGDQANPGADVGGGALPLGTKDGVTDVDWQSIPDASGAADATVPFGDQAFAGGDKESEPGNWGFQYEGAGVNPSKDNLLAAWSNGANSVSGTPSTFFNLAFTREAQTGNTFITFELNQLTKTWNNGTVDIPCRITGDLLVSYEVASGGSPPNVDVIVYKWNTDTFQDVGGDQCAKTGHFTQLDPQPYAEAAMNKNDITNYLTAGGLGNTFASGTFGETSLNLTGILQGVNDDACTNFGQVGMHTRSSTSIDSQLQDYITPVPVLVRSCKLKLDKQVSVNDPAGPYSDGPVNAHPGDTLYYKIAVQNTGSQPLNVTTSDTKCGGTLYSTATGTTPLSMPRTIQPGATGTYYCRHTVAAADGPDYVNKACAAGQTATGSTAQGDPDDSALCDTVTVHVYDPHLKLDKTQALTAGGSYVDTNLNVHVGDTVYYKLLVTNTGNVSLPVTTLDPPAAQTGCDGPLQDAPTNGSDVSMPDTIAPSASKTYYCTHVVVEKDGNSFTNHACASGSDSTGQAATPLGHDSLCDTTTVTILKPKLQIDKTQSTDGTTFTDSNLDVHVGDIVDYKLVVTNTGNTSLDVTTLDPPLLQTGCDGKLTSAPGGAEVPMPDTIAAGASATYYCAHKIVDGDGTSFTNHACTSGTDSTGTAAAGDPTAAALCDEVTVDILKPAIHVVKSGTPTTAHDGDKVVYSYVVTNTGDTPLGDIHVTDDKCSPAVYDSGDTNTDGKLDLTETWTYHCDYTVDHQAENASNDIVNTVVADGTDSHGTKVSDDDKWTTHIVHPAIDVTKHRDLATAHVGDTINYSIDVTNTGDVDLTVTPSDVSCDGFDNTPFSLKAGATTTLTCSHDVVAGDKDHYDNKACANGDDGFGGKVSDCDTVTTEIIHPAIHVVKSGTPTTAHDGDKVVYSYVVTNTGDTPLGDIHVTDDKCSPAVYDSGDTNTDGKLDLTETWTYHCDYTVDHQAENASNDIVNTVVADGTDKLDQTVKDDDNWTTHIVHPALAIDKTERVAGDPTYGDGPISVYVGDTIEYEIKVTNPGDTPMDLTNFSDPNCDSAPTGPSGDTNSDNLLDTSETWVYHCSHVVSASDTSPYRNTATATAHDTHGGSDITVSDHVDANVVNFSISGIKFEDQNANGQRDAGEPTIANWTIYLDSNDNGRFDVGEPSTTTDANGAYSFSGLNPGDYVVREEMPSDWHCSTPNPCDYRLTLKSRDPDKTGIDFGNWHDASLAGLKFHDRNGDGAAREAGEEGLAGWTFYVDYNGNGSKDAGEPAATSAADGSFKIDGIKPGTFAVREVGQTGWTCSFPSSCEYDLTFKSNDAKTGAEFGNWEPASVSGTKFQDTNGNGVHDAGEGPLQGFTFYVDYNGNGALDAGEPSAVSAADGTWSITGVKPGTYNVLEVADPNFTCTFPGTGDACRYQVSLQAGDAQTGKEFGNAPPAQIVLPERVTPGSAKLLGPTGCAAKAFNARVRGTKVQSVTFVLDGKTVKRFTKPVNSGVYSVRINPQSLRIGVHRLVVSVTFQKGTGTNPKKMRLSFQRCARKLSAPRFTG